MKKPHLISFDLCPFVQRSVITLLEKKVDFEITYIDLAEKPDWFLKISPFGKVPVLQEADTVLFESAVINEYLNDIYAPSMHPENALARAKNKAWIEFGSSLLMKQYQLIMAADADAYAQRYEVVQADLSKIETMLKGTPFFNGDAMNLIDAAYAPFFMRIDYLLPDTSDFFKDVPKCKLWSESLLAQDSVQKSVILTLREKFTAFFKEKGSYSLNNATITA